MIFRFVAAYSQSSRLRREFARDPDGTLDRYEIPTAERQHLLAGDRNKVAEQLRAEIDDMVSGRNQPMALWVTSYPQIVGRPQPRSGPPNRSIDIAISVLNLAPDVEVRFQLEQVKIDATILQIDPPVSAGIYTIHCQASFPIDGTWGVRVTNVVAGEKLSDFDDDYFEVNADL